MRGNDLARDQLAAHPDFLSRIERAAPRLETAAVATWAPIVEDLAGPLVDRRLHGAEDEDTARRAAALLGRHATDSLFVQLDEVDVAGHAHGAASSEYAAAYGPRTAWSATSSRLSSHAPPSRGSAGSSW